VEEDTATTDGMVVVRQGRACGLLVHRSASVVVVRYLVDRLVGHLVAAGRRAEGHRVVGNLAVDHDLYVAADHDDCLDLDDHEAERERCPADRTPRRRRNTPAPTSSVTVTVISSIYER